MKIRLGHTLAVACSLACLSFSISCTSTGDEAQDTSLDSSLGDSSGDSSVSNETDGDTDEGTEETSNADESESTSDISTIEESGQSDEEPDAALAEDQTEETAAAATSDENEEFDPFAASSATPVETSDDSQANPDTETPAEPSQIESTETTSSETVSNTEADPFARFDGLVDSEESNNSQANNEAYTAINAEEAEEGDQNFEDQTSTNAQASTPPASKPARSSRTSPSLDESSSIRYLVAPGDSLYEIANRIYGNSREWLNIAQANSISAPFLIYPGDELGIPAFGSAAQFAQAYQDAPETTVTVQAGDSLYSIAQKVLGNGSAWKYIWKSNQDTVPNPDLLSPGQVLRFKDYRNTPQASL